MPVHNVHERILPTSIEKLEAMLAKVASDDDPLWPGHRWWPQRFEGGLVVGAKGGHGPVHYKVESVAPRRIVWRFPKKGGFLGTHQLDAVPDDGGRSILRHSLDLRLVGRALVLWPMIRPLHDALIEDLMDNAQRAAGAIVQKPAKHSAYVRFARRRLGVPP